jgi:hypothetical protein
VPTRDLHFIGSLPPQITEKGTAEAMRWLLAQVGNRPLTTLPCDGDDRWIIKYLDALADRPAFTALRTGDSADYDRIPIYRPTTALSPADVSMDRLEYITTLMLAHQSIGADNDGLPLQISMPNPLDLALFVFVGKPDWRHPLRLLNGTRLVLKYLKTFEMALAAEVASIEAHKEANGFTGELHYQLETPAVLFALDRVPLPLRPLATRWLAKQVGRVISLLPRGKVWLHLCLGDLGRKAIAHQEDLRWAVRFLNLLLTHIVLAPPVHIPVGSGDEPVSVEPVFYVPLEELDRAYRLIAGVADERDPQASQRALELFETYSGRTALAVAAECGLGRMSVEQAIATIAMMKSLAEH